MGIEGMMTCCKSHGGARVRLDGDEDSLDLEQCHLQMVAICIRGRIMLLDRGLTVDDNEIYYARRH